MKLELEIEDDTAKHALENAFDTGIALWINGEAEFDEEGYQCQMERMEPEPMVDDLPPIKFVKFNIDIDGKGVKEYEVTRQKMIDCFSVFINKHPHFLEQYFPEYDGDATSDDAWFQVAAFGEAVFS